MNSKLMEVVEDVRDWIYWNVLGPMEGFFRGIDNLKVWLPIIWRDRDYDWTYLATMMSTKLRHMARLHEVWHQDDSARQMRICVALLDRLEAEEYLENIKKYHPGWEIYPLGKQRRLIRHSLYMQYQDKVYLSKLIGKYFDHWWV